MKGFGIVAALAVGVTIGVAAHGTSTSGIAGYAVGLVLAGVCTLIAGGIGLAVVIGISAGLRALIRATRLIPDDLRRTVESVAVLRRALRDPEYRAKVERQADIIRSRDDE